jgi:hypothetical protein
MGVFRKIVNRLKGTSGRHHRFRAVDGLAFRRRGREDPQRGEDGRDPGERPARRSTAEGGRGRLVERYPSNRRRSRPSLDWPLASPRARPPAFFGADRRGDFPATAPAAFQRRLWQAD